jgi:hypothetical protein
MPILGPQSDQYPCDGKSEGLSTKRPNQTSGLVLAFFSYKLSQILHIKVTEC